MSTLFKGRQQVVSFGARRAERISPDAERLELEVVRRELERERAAIAEEREKLEKERAEFEDDLGVLEDQRRFLDTQREKLRRDTEAFESERDALMRGQAVTAQRLRVESALEDGRRSREAERMRLQSEMAGLLQRRVQPAT